MMQVFHENTPKCLSQNSLHPNRLLPEVHTYTCCRLNRGIGVSSGLESSSIGVLIGRRTCQNTLFTSVKMDYDEPISVLVDWLKSIGWQIKWYTSRSMNDAASLDDKTVTISLRQIPRHQYYTLLHECAHVDLLAGPPKTRAGEPYGYIELWWGKVDERTLRHRVAVVIDEIAAWEHGIKLAHQMGISVDLEKYRDFRNRNLKSYFAWALNQESEEEID